MKSMQWLVANWATLTLIITGVGAVLAAAWKLAVMGLKAWADLQDARKDGLTLREIIAVIEKTDRATAKAEFAAIREQLDPHHSGNLADRVREISAKIKAAKKP